MLPDRTRPFSRYFGDKAFYILVLSILIPIIIQNAITNFVNLLDNVMVGQIGTEQMSGVAIVNQLMFVFNLCVFGAISGAGIFSAQFYGAKDLEGVRSCFRYKIIVGAILVSAAAVVFTLFGRQLISSYLNDADAPEQLAVTMHHALQYLRIMLWGLLPIALTQIYAGTLRDCGKTRLPMTAGIVAVFVNLVFNWLLIFDHFGFKGMGVRGAALATVISRYVELGIVTVFTHTKSDQYPFSKGLYRTLRIPGELIRGITVKGMPLLVNEALWSIGMAKLTQSYSLRGLSVVAALNISSTISNLFAVAFLSMGSATAIIIGQTLGANELKEAREKARQLIVFSLLISLGSGLLLLALSGLIPHVYNTEASVRHLASRLLQVYALCMPIFSFANSTYFILRSGGKTGLTFIFDSGFTWVICVPLAMLLIHYTTLETVTVYLIVQLSDIIKCAMGYSMLRKGIWVNNMVR